MDLTLAQLDELPKAVKLIGYGLVGVIALIFFVVLTNLFSIWIRALFSGARVTYTELIALRLRNLPVGMVVDTRITAVKSGLDVSIDDLSTHHLADRGAIGGRHELDSVFRQLRRLQAFDQAGMDSGRRIERVRASAQDHRVTRLEAQRAGIGCHVRPALIDDPDHAERRAHTLDMEAVRPVPF